MWWNGTSRCVPSSRTRRGCRSSACCPGPEPWTQGRRRRRREPVGPAVARRDGACLRPCQRGAVAGDVVRGVAVRARVVAVVPPHRHRRLVDAAVAAGSRDGLPGQAERESPRWAPFPVHVRRLCFVAKGIAGRRSRTRRPWSSRQLEFWRSTLAGFRRSWPCRWTGRGRRCSRRRARRCPSGWTPAVHARCSTHSPVAPTSRCSCVLQAGFAALLTRLGAGDGRAARNGGRRAAPTRRLYDLVGFFVNTRGVAGRHLGRPDVHGAAGAGAGESPGGTGESGRAVRAGGGGDQPGPSAARHPLFQVIDRPERPARSPA